ncbi:MAG: ABC transporter permease [Streptosporangiales bacterium]|nr:ABC transporter permease [Streptosporangiales bacterium]
MAVTAEATVAEIEGAARPSRRRDLFGRVWPALVVGIVLLGAWQLTTATGIVSRNLVSEPGAVAARVWHTLGGAPMYQKSIWVNVWVTARAVCIGYLIGAAAGVVIGYVLGRVPFVAAVFQPYIRALAAVPKIALVPLLVLIFGIGVKAETANVVLMVFIMVVFSTFSGIAAVRADLVNLARIMGAPRLTVATRIVVPAALPAIMSGLRAGVPFAFIGAITSEFIASSSGLGWLMQRATGQYDPTGLFTGLFYLTVLVWVLVQLLRIVESRLLRWQRR